MAASVDGGYICDYFTITGHMRKCDTWPVCAMFEAKKGRRKIVVRSSADGGVRVLTPAPKKRCRKNGVVSASDLRALKAFRENQMHIKNAAEAMGCSATSIVYHLDKVERLTGINPRVPDGIESILKKAESEGS